MVSQQGKRHRLLIKKPLLHLVDKASTRAYVSAHDHVSAHAVVAALDGTPANPRTNTSISNIFKE